MEWQLTLLLFFGSLIILMALGMPVAFAFLLTNVVFMFLFWGGQAGLVQLVYSIFNSIATFTLLPIPLFIIMGEVIFLSGIAPRMIDVVDEWLGRVPGRLGLVTVGAGTIFATLSGASMASTAVLGSVLVPQAEKRGYKKSMSLGPVLGSGPLAILIPPSNIAVLLGAVGEISVGRILIAIIVPGVLNAVIKAAYIIGRCWLQPSIAPPYDVSAIPMREKLSHTARYVLPLGFIVFLVVGLIFLGVATPSEAAACGALGSFILAAAYGKLNRALIRKSLGNTINVTVMLFTIIAGATAFSQVVAYSGASRGLIDFALSLPLPPILIIVAMMLVSLFLGMFINLGAIIMLTLPIFIPVVTALYFNTVWFAVVFLLSLEVGVTSPPFGLGLFVMKGVAPPDTTMADIYRAAIPFVACDLVELALLLSFPAVSLWLPALMR